MTFTDIQTDVLNRLGLTSTDDQTRIGLAINRKYREVTSAIGLQVSRNVLRQADATIGNRFLTFSDIEKIDSVSDRSTGEIVTLDQVSREEIDAAPLVDGIATAYSIYRMNADTVEIYLNCNPQTEFTLYANGQSSVAALSGSNEPAFPESYHDILLEGVLIDEYLKLEKISLSNNAERRFNKRLDDLKFWVVKSAARDIYQGKLSTGRAGGGSGGGGGSSSTGSTSYTQTGLITFDRSSAGDVAPFAVDADADAVVTNLDADKLDGLHSTSFFRTDASNAASLLFVDATHDIGASGATRPRDLFLSRNAVIGGTLGVTGNTNLDGTLAIGGSSDTILQRDAAAILAQRNGTTAQALRVYNTYTSGTNFESFEIDWKTQANFATVGTRTGTTGTGRRLVLSAQANSGSSNYAALGIQTTTQGDPYFRFGLFTNPGMGTTVSNTNADAVLASIEHTSTATSGTNGTLQILPTYNQTSGTAANTDLLINRTETAVGSGTQNLIDAQVGGSSKFSVNNSGNTSITGTLGVTGIITGRDVTTITNTDTGAQDDWSPTGKVTGNTIIYWTGASAMALTGIAGGSDGDTITIFNNGTGEVTFEHGSSSSASGNRFFNNVTSAPTPISTRGWATYYYDGSINFWVLLGHEQGAWITPTFAAGDYTAATGTWTVDAGDVTTCKYRVDGKTLSFNLFINLTDVSDSAAPIRRTLFGFTSTNAMQNINIRAINAGGAATAGLLVVAAGGTVMDLYPTVAAGNWTATTGDNTAVIAAGAIEVT